MPALMHGGITLCRLPWQHRDGMSQRMFVPEALASIEVPCPMPSALVW